jgi:protocatechuate 3,4-dioxygenase beta subunit
MRGRREFLAVAGALGAGLAAGPAAAQQRLAPTPSDAEGPFYPTRLPADADADLVRLAGVSREAEGKRLHIRGTVRGVDGAPLAGALLEIWQTDARGNYIHPQGAIVGPRDDAFQGYGRTASDAAGAYAFRTILPVAYRGRPPHVHFRVTAAGRRTLTTQLYFVPGSARRELVVPPVALAGAEPDAVLSVFDIVLA